MIRVVSILLALFVAAQSTAVASARMVCRYTGKVMENCPCPGRGAESVVEKAGCCTVISSDAAPVAAPRETAVHSLGLLAVAAVRWEADAPRARAVEPPVEGPPPVERQYLKLRQLLL